MEVWLISAAAFAFSLLCGWLNPRWKLLRPIIASATFLLLAVMLFGLLIIAWPDFRRHFSYPVQFYGGLGVRHGLLVAGGIASGWILCEGLRRKRGFHVVIAVLFIFGVPCAYQRLSAHDYSALSTSAASGQVTMQSSGYTCAAASLSNFTALTGPTLSERGAAELMRLDQFGAGIWQIGYALQKLGYTGEEISTQHIGEVRFPALLIVAFNADVDHAVLVTGRTGSDYATVDPLVGRVNYPAAWFEQRWRFKGVMGLHR